MEYRKEIDGLRAFAVLPVIFFHAGFDLFKGGFVGVDIFFVISGYLITTILIEDIDNKRFSIINFYERRIRRLLPALFTVLIITTIVAYFLFYPSDLKQFSKSSLSVLAFLSNVFFFKTYSDYFATEAELTPLLHTWSLAVEEQYYLLFPIFLILVWRFGRSRVFWLIALFSISSLLLSEWLWRNHPIANFYLAPTRAWELLFGSMTAFIALKRGVQGNNILAITGLTAIIFSIFFYDELTPFPSVYSLVPVIGVVLLILFADNKTWVARLLGSKVFVGIGLISYSAYLWHQPLISFYRKLFGINLDTVTACSLIIITFSLAFLSWRFIEKPFRDVNQFNRRNIFISALLACTLIGAINLFFVLTNGVEYRYNIPPKEHSWGYIKCHGGDNYENQFEECLGKGDSSGNGDIYLIGDSHAAQLTFALKAVAEMRNKEFFFINTGAGSDNYPFSFWKRDVSSDRLLDHLLTVAKEGDFFITSFHRGYLNKYRDSHLMLNVEIDLGKKASLFKKNFSSYSESIAKKGLNVYLIKDGPLLNDIDTSLEGCMYKYQKSKTPSCVISFEQDDYTRFRQKKVFNELASNYSFVETIDYLPLLYNEGFFSPISKEGTYLMLDRQHITEAVSLELVDFFHSSLKQLN